MTLCMIQNHGSGLSNFSAGKVMWLWLNPVRLMNHMHPITPRVLLFIFFYQTLIQICIRKGKDCRIHFLEMIPPPRHTEVAHHHHRFSLKRFLHHRRSSSTSLHWHCLLARIPSLLQLRRLRTSLRSPCLAPLRHPQPHKILLHLVIRLRVVTPILDVSRKSSMY
jgi:hypothetical protein